MSRWRPVPKGQLLAEVLMKRVVDAAGAAFTHGWSKDQARQAATLIDAALFAAALADFDPRIIQMEMSGYFASGGCQIGACGEEYVRAIDEVDLGGASFIDELSNAARWDGLA